MLIAGVNRTVTSCLPKFSKYNAQKFVAELHRLHFKVGFHLMGPDSGSPKAEDTAVQKEEARQNTHIERTSSQFRQSGFFLTRIENVRQATPFVRLIDLKVLPPASQPIDGLPDHQCEQPHLFTFKPGQWIDTHVPHLLKPGGFSFISTPREFVAQGTASLAIQRTDNPPSMWLWRENIVGQNVMIRVGGNFTFPPSSISPKLDEIDYVQFIAGGVGINPLISMLRYICEEHILRPDAKIVLLYLVRQREEALFMDILSDVKRRFGNRFDCHLWITRQSPSSNAPFISNVTLHSRQAVSTEIVGKTWDWWDSFLDIALEGFDSKTRRDKSLVYICGPQGLTDRLVELYKDRGLQTDDGHVQVEKWW